MGPRSAAILANTPPNSQLLSLFADLLYVDQVGDGLQRQIGRRHLVGAAFELGLQKLLVRHIFLVFEVMLDTCPAIHRDGAKLNFDAHATAEFEAIIASLRFGPL